MAESSSLVTSPFEVNSGSGDFGSVYEIEREEEYYPLVYEVESSPTGFRGVSGDVQILSEYHDFDLLDQPTLCLPSPTCCGSSLREVDINRIKNAYNISESVDLRIPLEDEGPKNAYNISESVDLRIPLEDEGPDCNRPDEVVVYEAFFALGLRDSVPSLVAKIANFIGISPGQLNPRAWRLLIAIQVFSEIYPVSLGLEEVLFVYFFKCYDSVNYLYLIQKRRPDSSPLVYDLDRQLSSYEMSILDAVPGDGSIGDDALQMFCEAMSDIPASITAPPLQTEQVGPKRSVTTVNLTRQPARTTKRKSHVCPGGSLLTASDHSIALGNLSKQVFPRDREALNELGHAAILEKSQHLLLEVMYVCSHVKTELDVLTEEVARLKEANQLLKKDKEAEISRRDSLITTKEAEGKTLKDQVYDLTSQLNLMTVNSKQLEQDLALHRKKLRVAGPAATILCRWKMVQEYMNGHAKNWEPLPVEQQFREVETACAKLNGEVPLVFPEAFTTFPEATSAPTSTE